VTGFFGIDGHSRSEKGLDAHTPRVEIATVFIANSTVSVITVTALRSVASVLSLDATNVWGVGGCHAVRFPDVHLHTTCTVHSSTGVLVVGRGFPIESVGLAVDKLDVVRALSIAISRTVFSAGFVTGMFRHTTVCVHRYEVKSTVKSTGKVRYVDVEGKFFVLQLEHSVRRVALRQINTRSDVGRVRTVSNELQGEIGTANRDTVRARVVRTVEGTVCGAGDGVWTEGLVPFVTCVAVGGSGGSVGPSPVRIEDDRVLFGGAGTAS